MPAQMTQMVQIYSASMCFSSHILSPRLPRSGSTAAPGEGPIPWHQCFTVKNGGTWVLWGWDGMAIADLSAVQKSLGTLFSNLGVSQSIFMQKMLQAMCSAGGGLDFELPHLQSREENSWQTDRAGGIHFSMHVRQSWSYHGVKIGNWNNLVDSEDLLTGNQGRSIISAPFCPATPRPEDTSPAGLSHAAGA